jgi:hypothetical protein
MPIAFLAHISVDFFHYADKFMTRHALEIQIAARDLQVRVADTGEKDTNEGFAFNRSWHGIITIKPKARFPAHQCSHDISPHGPSSD